MSLHVPRTTRIATACTAWVDAPWFNIASFAVIALNALMLGLETYDGLLAAAGPALHGIEYACLTGFGAELLVRFAATLDRPRDFARDPWNIFDLALLISPLLPGFRENVTILRLLRLARLVRTFRLFPSLRVILIGIRRALPGLGSFLTITVLVLYGYAMLGWMMFGDAFPERYGTVGQAMLTLFLLLSLDGITDTLQAGREVSDWAVLYYVSYMVAACYLLTNLLVGLVLTALQEAHEAERASRAPKPAEPAAAVRPAEPAAPVPPADGEPLGEQLDRLRAAVESLEARLAGELRAGDALVPRPSGPARHAEPPVPSATP
jgi:voltage-gated sodium channel